MKTDPRVVIAIGMVITFLGSLGQHQYTLLSSNWQMIYPNLIQGVGFALIFVPITTVSLSSIPRHRIADATGLNSLIRQIGGAIGVAVFATLLTNDAVVARDVMRSHLSASDPTVLQRVNLVQGAMSAYTTDPVATQHAALQYLQGVITGQSTVVSFDGLFLLSGICLLILAPFVFTIKLNRADLISDTHKE